ARRHCGGRLPAPADPRGARAPAKPSIQPRARAPLRAACARRVRPGASRLQALIGSPGVKLRAALMFGAEEGTRTPTVLPPLGPEPSASTNSATSAARRDFS